MTLPQDCTVTGIETLYSQLQSLSLEQGITLDASEVMHLDLSFMQCLKALEKQNISISVSNPSDAAKSYFRLYQANHYLEGEH